MDTHNFWYWLIAGLTNLIVAVAELLPFHPTIGLNEFVYNFLAATATPILFYVGAYFNLCWFALFVGLFAISETARAAFATYRTIAKMLPLP